MFQCSATSTVSRYRTLYWFCIWHSTFMRACFLVSFKIYVFMVWCDLHWLGFVRHALENAGLSDCISYTAIVEIQTTRNRDFCMARGRKDRKSKRERQRVKKEKSKKKTDKNYWAHLTGTTNGEYFMMNAYNNFHGLFSPLSISLSAHSLSVYAQAFANDTQWQFDAILLAGRSVRFDSFA